MKNLEEKKKPSIALIRVGYLPVTTTSEFASRLVPGLAPQRKAGILCKKFQMKRIRIGWR